MKKMRIKHLLSVLLYIVFIDAMWIVSVAMPLYQSQLGAIVNQKEYFIQAAVLIYALLFGGFYVLILRWMAQHPPSHGDSCCDLRSDNLWRVFFNKLYNFPILVFVACGD